ncbi:MAG: hypothetical protein GX130_14430 [Candidatus Hydrogenedens sp.]|jgi:hypothetical protein|nr:hypothetical protein [Candidatus Hydrogenedens sp.]
MSLESSILRHPSSVQLMEYAESLVDDDSPVCVLMAAHLSRCPDCANEVRAIQQSLKLTALATLPESSQTLSHSILLQARKEIARPPAKRPSFLYPFLRSVACLVGILLLAAISFSAALQEGSEFSSIAVQAEARPIPTPENSWTPSRPFSGTVVQALAASIAIQGNTLSNTGQRRIVDFLDQDLDAALAALERNPGCVRATQIVDSEAQKRLEGLRTLFVDRTL